MILNWFKERSLRGADSIPYIRSNNIDILANLRHMLRAQGTGTVQ